MVLFDIARCQKKHLDKLDSLVPITWVSGAPLGVKISTKHQNIPISKHFFILTPNQILSCFCFLETSLAFEKATNLAHWKAKLNLRIFVYIENKTKNWDKFQIFVIGAQGLTQNGPYGPQDIGPMS